MKRLLTAFLLLPVLAMAKPAPHFRAELLSGERTSLKELQKPEKGLLLCFWATWCVPCMEELRLVSEKVKNNPNLPFDVITVNVDSAETSSDIRSTVTQQNVKFPILLDPKHEIFSRYHQGKSLPFSALIDAQGNLVSTFEGLQEDMFKKIFAALKKEEPVAKAE